MSDYELIRAAQMQQNELWEDPEFPAMRSSVFYHQIPPFRFEWKRSRELYDNPTFIADTDIFDVVSGRLGDKWLLSCIEVLYHCKGLFNKVVPSDQQTTESYSGVFRFRLFWRGKWTEVLVDDRLPTVNGVLAFMHCAHSQQMWPALLEKAYAKMHGSYEALKYGNLTDGLVEFTGGIPSSISLSTSWVSGDAEYLQSFMDTATVVTACCIPNDDMEKPTPNYIVPGVNYVVYDIEKVEIDDFGGRVLYMVQLGRPGRQVNRNMISPVTSLPSHLRERFASSAKAMWMSYADFARIFTNIDMVHFDSDTSKSDPSLYDKLMWHVKSCQGRWKKGVTAGGCKNPNNIFFHMNPQIQLVLNEPTTVVISVNQHSVMEPKVIGFSIYKIPKPLKEIAPPKFFKSYKTTNNSKYTNSRQVSERYHLESGAYLVIPTTYEPRDEADFTLRVFTMLPITMTVLDCAPQMLKSAILKAPAGTDASSFTVYESQFLHLADEHGTINAFELQELLERCLPNDYIKSCATIETCRQIILSLEKDGSGRICLHDFKDLICSLKQWQLVFKDHASEKVGVLRIERFRDALRDVGFIIPERALSLLVFKYMRKDGMLRFGDFVSAVVFLNRAFYSFFRNCPSPAYKVTFTFSEWFNSILTC